MTSSSELQFASESSRSSVPPIVPPSRQHEPLTLTGWISWMTIVLITVGMFTLTALSQAYLAKEGSQEASVTDLMPIEMQGKMLVGQKGLVGLTNITPSSDARKNEAENEENQDATEEASNRKAPSTNTTPSSQLPTQLDVGPYEQRLCYSLLLNELQGADAALQHLKLTDTRADQAQFNLTDDQKKLRSAVVAILEDYAQGDQDASEVDDESKSLIKKRLGWIGELALHPPGTSDQDTRRQLLSQANQAMFVMMGGIFMGLAMLGTGFIVVIGYLVLLASGRLRGSFQNQSGRHNLYVETFAIWMLTFFGFQLTLPAVMSLVGVADPTMILSLMPFIFFGSLLVLVWPVARGLTFSQVCQDIGWRLGNPLVEGAIGGISYLAILPGLALALVIVLIMMAIFAPEQSAEVFSRGSGPSHPIQEYLAKGGLQLVLLVALTAGVAAPIVEETMFRGVLYRHLRDWTFAGSRWLSVLFSSLLNSLIFAAIHPQGIFGIPLLMALAIGFSFVREWRSSLIGPIVMHGINNLLVTMFLFFLL